MEASWFAGRLKELREARGLTQPQVAEQAGLSKGGIADLEQGRRRPSWETVLVLCKVLRVKPNDFAVQPAGQGVAARGLPRKADTETAPAKKKRKPPAG